MAGNEILYYALFGLGLGLFLFFKGFQWLREKRLIENIPTSKIRSLAMGLVEIFGKVLPTNEGVVLSPFSNTKCVYYRYLVEEYRQQGKNSNWVTINTGKYLHPFYLKDNTGQVLVDPDDAEISIPLSYEYKSGFGKSTPGTIKTFLSGINVSSNTLFGLNRNLRYREYFIKPQENLYVIGTAGDNPHMEESSSIKNEEDIMIQKGNTKQFYFISNKGEKEILKRFKWKIAAGLFGGSILSLICLSIILINLGVF